MHIPDWVRHEWDRIGAWVFAVAGAIVLILGWYGVSGNGYPAKELPYIISGGLGGIFLLGIGATLWLSADLRDEWGKLNRIERKLTDIDESIAAFQSRNPNWPSGNPGTPAVEDASLGGTQRSVR